MPLGLGVGGGGGGGNGEGAMVDEDVFLDGIILANDEAALLLLDRPDAVASGCSCTVGRQTLHSSQRHLTQDLFHPGILSTAASCFSSTCSQARSKLSASRDSFTLVT